MKIVYFGTPPIAAEVLEFLVENGVEVLAIVTKGDKPRGRSGKPVFSAVKEFALEKFPNIPLYQPDKASTPAFEEKLSLFGADLFVVFAYGEIIKQNLLDLPRYGCINLHPSLLPKYRGPAPIRFALLDGAKETGVSVIEMTLKMDAGDLLAQEKVSIPSGMDCEQLESVLIPLGAETLLKVIKNYAYHNEHKTPQDSTLATYVQKIDATMAEIDWSQSAETIHNQIRAFSPKPGAWCSVVVNGKLKRLKLFRATPTIEVPQYQKDQWVVSCGVGNLSLLDLQLEGKKRLTISEFTRGFQSAPLLGPF
ncbi:methionyl-tRNA formyltransferase [Candidatus Neptunichlamydia sp. REUL1]|uniref:methionyl-tRNA formyltransferase n=1 Tax=Candidatus Neptunichlamydia sp. REUL1 TaxID=3064277 RepID=UPI00292F1818|nr:methionyl-tRNA formyltransferase [Candidatus Neptunochlamydia sp. REUL1]